MSSSARLALASAFVVLLALAGCSSDSGSDDAAPAKDTAKTTTTTKTTKTTQAGSGGSDTTVAGGGGELGPDAQQVIDTIEAVDTTDFCSGLRGVVTAFSASLAAPSGSITDAERAQIDDAVGQLLDEVGNAVPPAIKDDWDTAAPALSTSPAQQTKAEQEALANVSKWVSSNCALPGN